MRRHRPGAFSIVELIVALAVLAIFTGLLLGAVQKVRDRAAAAAVANAARQVVFASHNYATSRDGQLANVDGDRPNQGLGLLWALRPELGQASWDDSPPPLLRPRCDPTFQATYVEQLDVNKWEERPDGAVAFAGNPLLFRKGARLATAASDGLSDTIAIVTHYSHCRVTGYWPSLLGGGCMNESGVPIPCDFLSMRRTTFADPMYFDVLPVSSVVNGARITRGSEDRTFQHRPSPAACDHRVPQSLTAGGLTVGMADGSVRVVRPDVSQAVFWGAVTPNGGEVLAWND